MLAALTWTILLATSTSALASSVPQNRGASPTIARPLHTYVSGKIQFAAANLGPGVKRVVFAVDGRRIWSTTRRPYRFARTGMLNTWALRDGRHVLTLKVLYRRRHTREIRKTIVVRNRAHASRGAEGGSLGGNVGAFGPPRGGVPGPSVAAFNRGTFQFSTTWPMSLEASRYQFITIAGNQHWLVPLLHALNPNLKILLYQSIVNTNANDYSYMQTVTGCTAYRADLLAHPDWLLHDQNGQIINEPYTTDRYVTDVGNPGYQQQCATNAAVLAKQYGFDGVFWDVVMGRIDWAVSRGISVPEYPTQTSWVAAMTSALDYIAPALHRQGLISIGNVSGTPSAAVWENWAGVLDGVEEESWTDGKLGPAQQIPFWKTKLAELAWTQANGRYELVHSYNGTEAENAYGLASMLLAANGTASYETSNTNYLSNENWFPEYPQAQALGAPAGPYSILRNGVYERAFSHGIVLVNPTATSRPSFSLAAGPYSGSGLSNVSSVSMGPTSGLILLKSG
jgi:hypothetical protein